MNQRASRVPPTYKLLVAKADVKWNRLEPGSDGSFQRYLASLPPVIGLAFGACSEWSKSVDLLVGQMAELVLPGALRMLVAIFFLIPFSFWCCSFLSSVFCSSFFLLLSMWASTKNLT